MYFTCLNNLATMYATVSQITSTTVAIKKIRYTLANVSSKFIMNRDVSVETFELKILCDLSYAAHDTNPKKQIVKVITAR